MKTQTKTRSLFLACVALATVLIAPATVRADAAGTKPYKGTEVTTSRTDDLGTDFWTDPFLEAARLSPVGFYAGDSKVLGQGHDNFNGAFTTVNHQILYVTSFTPSFDPVTGIVFIWAEKTYQNGVKIWAAIVGEVDFSTGTVEGEWLSFVVDDPTSAPTGSGTWTATLRPDLGERFYETTIVGRVMTKGALKKR